MTLAASTQKWYEAVWGKETAPCWGTGKGDEHWLSPSLSRPSSVTLATFQIQGLWEGLHCLNTAWDAVPWSTSIPELLTSEVVPHSSLSSPPGLLLSPTSFSSSPWFLNTRAHPTLQQSCQGAQATEIWPYQEREREERDQHCPLNKGHGRRTVQGCSQEETASVAIRGRYLHHKPAPLIFHWRHCPLTVQPQCQCWGWERSVSIVFPSARGFSFTSFVQTSAETKQENGKLPDPAARPPQ